MSDWVEVSVTNSGTWDMEKPLIGTFLGTKEDVGPNGSKMHTVKTEDGNIGAWGSAVLDNKLAEVATGAQVKIEYLGKVKNPKTNREYKDFSVMVKPGEASDVELASIPF